MALSFEARLNNVSEFRVNTLQRFLTEIGSLRELVVFCKCLKHRADGRALDQRFDQARGFRHLCHASLKIGLAQI